MSDDPLLTPVQFAKGVGPDRAKKLKKLEIETVRDLLWHLPRDLLDLSDVRSIPDIEADQLVSVYGVVVDMDGKHLSKGRTMSAILIENDGSYLRGVWFNQAWVLKTFRHGQRVLLSGKPKKKSGRWELSHPRYQFLEEDDEAAIRGEVLPRYPLTEGLRMHEMRRMTREAVAEYADQISDPLPEPLRKSRSIPSLSESLKLVHTPKTADEFERGKSRLIFDDLLEFQLGVALRRKAWKQRPQADPLPMSTKIDSRIRRLFPFEFTWAQNRAIKEIVHDLGSSSAMHRLLQADVGAGKTAIAIYAILVAIAAGKQAVLMAPTEVLARQHWNTVEGLLKESRVERRLLIGALPESEKRQVREQIESGEIQFVVGTQAVIQDSVRFHDLGLVVIDEQHKFGVMQRARFGAEERSPHTLVMTATPIPRSLCLTQFGDLDLSVMDELPPGRQRIVTSLVTDGPPKLKAWSFVKEQLQQGRQAYVVCPRVSVEQKGKQLSDVDTVARTLSRGILKEFRLAVLHGQLSSEEKSEIMSEFEEGDLDVLVATTVIEVGIDVPNATLMVIMDSESFGLSQLHQLRGRIGRGRFQGYCFLFSRSEEADVLSRLNVLSSTSDGFRVAEADFEIRGPGDVLGTRQHGQLPLKVADLVRDRELLEQARDVAFSLVNSGEFQTAPYRQLRETVFTRFGAIMELPRSG